MRAVAVAAAVVSLLVASAAGARALAAQPGTQTPDFRVEIWGDAIVNFDARIAAYAKLRRALEQGLPALAVTTDPAEILRAETALAERIRAARAGARQGDIFTRRISAAFKRVLRAETNAGRCAAIRDDGPGQFSYRTNRTYPKEQPLSTVPAGILAVLPALPPDVQYRFIGRHLVLHDTRANVILDRIHDAIRCAIPPSPR